MHLSRARARPCTEIILTFHMDLPRNSSDIFCRPFIKSYEILEGVLILIPYLARNMFNWDSFWEPGKKGKRENHLNLKTRWPPGGFAGKVSKLVLPGLSGRRGFRL